MTRATPGTFVATGLEPAFAELPLTIGVLLADDYIERVRRATAGMARIKCVSTLERDEPLDLLIVDPCRLTPRPDDAAMVRDLSSAGVPCVFYTESSPRALRSVVGVADVSAVRLVLFGIDDDPAAFGGLLHLAPRRSHAQRLVNALAGGLEPLVPVARVALITVLRRPDRFFDAGDVARAAGLSRRPLDRLLARASLAPARNWVVGARVWHALFLIVRERCIVEAAASRLGYADSKGLRRHLDAVWGATPRTLATTSDDQLLCEVIAYLKTRNSE